MRLHIFIVFLICFSCKKNNQKDLQNSDSKIPIVDTISSEKPKKEIKSFEIKNTQWIEIEKGLGKFKTLDNEWKRKVEVGENEILIELMEPSTYTIEKIIRKNNQTLLKIKGAGWYYRFKWEDKEKHICRWDYIYNTKIDSSFSYYAIQKGYNIN